MTLAAQLAIKAHTERMKALVNIEQKLSSTFNKDADESDSSSVSSDGFGDEISQ